ncbi:ATP-grasp domain-containing protein [Amycolatopsis aidingensis]|uniref:ATP-grasp domain-containing protein n=1 Tax=Amycolatopsis aidingensis TaxID=2842453 RepID=UPI001C0ACDFB|nr:ATP-grasp domain-containing protein [Amycolatopsis aidingensis]
MSTNVFVLGLDEGNLAELQRIPGTEHIRFHSLLTVEELVHSDELRLTELLAKARAQLSGFQGNVDAILGYWDFPTSSMVPLLCREFGLPSATLEAVVTCEHKYWSRLAQQEVINEYPRFGLVNLDDTAPPRGLGYPMWIKPIKAYSSELAFEVHDHEEFTGALDVIRGGIDRVGKPFQHLLDHLDLPSRVAEAGGQACIAEESASGTQVTVEGYSTGSQVRAYGVIDSHTYPDSASFLRYQYPSALPQAVQDRLADIACRVIEHIGLSHVAFNIEFFWDADRDAITLLEVNPRHSQSHARLFHEVDGVPNHQCSLRLALGLPPDLPHRQGAYPVAAKWFLRHFADGVVRRSPTPEEVTAITDRIPGCSAEVSVRTGDRLSAQHGQDSYSYVLATVYTGADSERELVRKYERCVAELPFEIEDREE